MSTQNTSIEWTNATWGPIRGCTRVSEGCRNCYAERQAFRFAGKGGPYEGLVKITNGHPQWTGEVKFVAEALNQPLRWREPKRIFVNSMSDLFHEKVTDQQITDIFGIMALAHWHTFQILTKRPERMRDYLQAGDHGILEQYKQMREVGGMAPKWFFRALDRQRHDGIELRWPLPNVWMGVSVENQKTADERIPLLLQTPAVVRWLSCEPLLGPLNIVRYLGHRTYRCKCDFHDTERELTFVGGDVYCCAQCGEKCDILPAVNWTVCGGESGPNSRPMHFDWVISLRDQCADARTPFFFKQWGAHLPVHPGTVDRGQIIRDGDECFERVGKKAAGRLLDGKEWSEYPANSTTAVINV